jgi:hypothetical protein
MKSRIIKETKASFNGCFVKKKNFLCIISKVRSTAAVETGAVVMVLSKKK